MNQVELIARARRKEAGAWEDIVRQHQEAVFRLAFLTLGDSEEAKDVAQETFMRAMKSLDSFDSERPLKPWLLKIAVNLARNRKRGAGRYWAFLQRLTRGHREEAVEVEGQSIDKEEARLLWQAVGRLGQNDQDVIHLRYFLQMPVEEAAEVLNVAPGTIKSRLHRALERLRALILAEYPHLASERER